MELSEYIRKHAEVFQETGNQIKDSADTLGEVHDSVTHIASMFTNHIEHPELYTIDWTKVIENIGNLMYGLQGFCTVNSLDIPQILDRSMSKRSLGKFIDEKLPFNGDKEEIEGVMD